MVKGVHGNGLDITYQYDRNSNRLGRHNAVAGDRGERYQYDSLNRLANFAFNKGDVNSPWMEKERS